MRISALSLRLRHLLLGTSALTGFALAATAQAGQAALPTNGVVTVGSATIAQASANQLKITTSTNRTVIDWQSFSIGNGNKVAIQQPGSNSITVNEVTGSDPSQIFGDLSSNGRVVLANPNGIWFGPNSHVDVAGLVASTATLSADAKKAFAAGGRLSLDTAGNPTASIVNDGHITVAGEGLAALVAPGVRNNGVIEATLGSVTLASGETSTLDFYGDGLVSMAVTSPVQALAIGPDGKPFTATIENKGKIAAQHVLVTADVVKGVVDNSINMSGVVEAKGVTVSGGDIVLDGGDGDVTVSGKLDVTSQQATGGTVQVTGGTVTVASTAKIDASGAKGGGTIQIGGGPHGGGSLKHAKTVLVQGGSAILANATSQGDGGTVSIWSDQATTFNGSVEAKGAGIGGNGGWVETSSENQLTVGLGATVNTLAPDGKVGTWLLDPLSIEVAATGSGTLTGAADTTDTSTAVTIAASTIDSATSNVVLSALTSITVDSGAAINITASGVGITFEGAGGSVATGPTGGTTLNANITTNGGVVQIKGQTFLGTDVSINTGTTAGSITLGTVDSNVSGLNLTLTTGGTATLGTVGGGGVGTLANLMVTGSSILLGGNVTASLEQEYDGPVTLTADATLTNGIVQFDSTVDGAFALNIQIAPANGQLLAKQSIGSKVPLASLYISAPIAYVAEYATNRDIITTTGAITFANSGVQTFHDAVIRSQAGDIDVSLNNTIDSENNQGIVLSAAGNINLGNIQFGSTSTFSNINIVSNTVTQSSATFGGTTPTYVTTNGAAQSLSGTVDFDTIVPGGPLTLTGGGTTITANNEGIILSGPISGAGQALSVTASGSILLEGAIGGTGASALSSLLVDSTASSLTVATPIEVSGIQGITLKAQGGITTQAGATLTATAGPVTVSSYYGGVYINGAISSAKGAGVYGNAGNKLTSTGHNVGIYAAITDTGTSLSALGGDGLMPNRYGILLGTHGGSILTNASGSLTTARPLYVRIGETGSITLGGTVSANSVVLSAQGGVTTQAGGTITTGTLGGFTELVEILGGSSAVVIGAPITTGGELSISGAGITLGGAITDTSAASTIVLSSTAAVTQSAPVDTSYLQLLGTGGTFTLTNTLNNIGTLAANTGSLALDNGGNALAILSNVALTGGLSIATTGTLTLGAGTIANLGITAGNSIDLSSTTQVVLASTNVTLTNAAGTGGITLPAVDAATSGADGLTVKAAGDVSLDGTIGGANALSALYVHSNTGTLTVAAPINATGTAGIILDGYGAVTISNGASLTATTGPILISSDHAGIYVNGAINSGLGTGIYSNTSGNGSTGNNVGIYAAITDTGTSTTNLNNVGTGSLLYGIVVKADGGAIITNASASLTTARPLILEIGGGGGITVGDTISANAVILNALGGVTIQSGGTITTSTGPSTEFVEILGGNDAVTTAAPITSGGHIAIYGTGITLGAAINDASNIVVLGSTGAAVTQSAPIYAGSLQLLGAGGTFTLTNTLNNIGTLAADTGSLALDNGGHDLTIGQVGFTATPTTGITLTGGLSIATTGTLTLGAGTIANLGITAGNSIDLSSTTQVVLASTNVTLTNAAGTGGITLPAVDAATSGADGLTVKAAGDVSLDGTIGGANALSALYVHSNTGTLTVAAPINASNSINLYAASDLTTTSAATLTSANGAVTVSSGAGGVTIGGAVSAAAGIAIYGNVSGAAGATGHDVAINASLTDMDEVSVQNTSGYGIYVGTQNGSIMTNASSILSSVRGISVQTIGADRGSIAVGGTINSFGSAGDELSIGAASITLASGGTIESGGVTITLAGDSGIVLDGVLYAPTFTLGVLLRTAGTVTESGTITVGNLLLEGFQGGTVDNTVGVFQLTSATNDVGTLAVNAQSVTLNNGGNDLTIGTVAGTAGVTLTGDLMLTNVGTLFLGNNVSVDGAGGIDFSGISGEVVLDADVTLDTSAGTGGITLPTVDATYNNARSLTLNSGKSVVFDGKVGYQYSLASLNVTASNGGTIALPSYIVTNTSQTFAGPVVVTQPGVTTLRNIGTSVVFTSTVDGATGNETLAMNAGEGDSNFTFEGAVAGGTGLADLDLQTFGTITFASTLGGGSQGLGVVSIRSPVIFLGGDVTTTGSQTFTGATTLTNDVTLTSNTAGITFNSTIDSDTITARSITLVATDNVEIDDNVGASQAVNNFTVSAPALVGPNGGPPPFIGAVGTISYPGFSGSEGSLLMTSYTGNTDLTGNYVFTGDITVTVTGGSFTLDGTIDGAGNLTIIDAGNTITISAGGIIGGMTQPASITLAAAHVLIGGSVISTGAFAAHIAAGGDFTLSGGGSITTTGAGGTVSIAPDSTYNVAGSHPGMGTYYGAGLNITIAGNVNSSDGVYIKAADQSVAVTTPGTIIVQGTITNNETSAATGLSFGDSPQAADLVLYAGVGGEIDLDTGMQLASPLSGNIALIADKLVVADAVANILTFVPTGGEAPGTLIVAPASTTAQLLGGTDYADFTQGANPGTSAILTGSIAGGGPESAIAVIPSGGKSYAYTSVGDVFTIPQNVITALSGNNSANSAVGQLAIGLAGMQTATTVGDGSATPISLPGNTAIIGNTVTVASPVNATGNLALYATTNSGTGITISAAIQAGSLSAYNPNGADFHFYAPVTTTGALTVNTHYGSFVNAGAGTLMAGGALYIRADYGITLTNPVHSDTGVTLTSNGGDGGGGSIYVNGTITTPGTLAMEAFYGPISISNTGSITVGTFQIAGDVGFTSNSTITIAGTVTATGTASSAINAKLDEIDISGRISTAGDLSIVSNYAYASSGLISITNTGSITAAGALTISGGPVDIDGTLAGSSFAISALDAQAGVAISIGATGSVTATGTAASSISTGPTGIVIAGNVSTYGALAITDGANDSHNGRITIANGGTVTASHGYVLIGATDSRFTDIDIAGTVSGQGVTIAAGGSSATYRSSYASVMIEGSARITNTSAISANNANSADLTIFTLAQGTLTIGDGAQIIANSGNIGLITDNLVVSPGTATVATLGGTLIFSPASSQGTFTAPGLVLTGYQVYPAGSGTVFTIGSNISAATLAFLSGGGTGMRNAGTSAGGLQIGFAGTTNTVSIADSTTFTTNTTIYGGDINSTGTINASGALTLDSSGTLSLGGSVTTVGDQHFTGTVQLTGDTVLTATGTGSLIRFDNSVDGTDSLTISNAAGTVSFGGNIGNLVELNALQVTAGQIVLGGGFVKTSGGQTYDGAVAVAGANLTLSDGNGAVSFAGTVDGMVGTENLTIDAGEGGSGAITFDQAVAAGVGLNSLVINVGPHAVMFDAAVGVTPSSGHAGLGLLNVTGGLITLTDNVTTSAGQTYEGAVTLANSVTLTDANNAGSTGIDFGSTLDGAKDLTLTLGAGGGSGSIIFNQAVGGMMPLSSLTVTGTLAPGFSITTTGDQTYNSEIDLSGESSFTSLNGGTITFHGQITRSGGEGVGLEVLTTGSAIFASDIGANGNPLDTVTIDANEITLGGSVYTDGGQTYGGEAELVDNTVSLAGSVSLVGSNQLLSDTGDGITFVGSITGQGSAQQLTVIAPDGTVSFGGPGDPTTVSNLGTLAVTAGTIELNSTITTSGPQTYTGAVQLVGDSTINASATDVGITLVTFTSTIDSGNYGSFGLTINAPEADVELGGAIGSTTPLSAFTLSAGELNASTTYSGTPTIALVNAASPSITLTGFEQELTGAVGGNYTFTSGALVLLDGVIMLDGNTVITVTGSDVDITGTIDGPYSLTIKDMSNNSITVVGAIGGSTALSSLFLSALGGITLGTTINTTGAQTYDSAVTLSAATALNSAGAGGAAVQFDSVTNGPGQALTISNQAGTVSFAGPIGAGGALGSFSVTAAGITLTGDVATNGSQTYDGAVTLAAATTELGSLDSGIAFSGTINGTVGTESLTLAGGSNGSNITLGGAVGTLQGLGSLAVVQGSQGTITLLGDVKTSAGQMYSGAVTVAGGNVALTDTGTAGISFAGTVDGSAGTANLTINAGGPVAFGAAVGGTVSLGSLTVTAGSITLPASVNTSGDQSFAGAITLAGDTVLAAGGTISLSGSLDGTTADSQSLTISSASALQLGGVTGTPITIGGSVELDNFTDAAATVLLGTTTIDTFGSIVITGSVNGAQGLTLNDGAQSTAIVELTGGIGTTTPLTSLAVTALDGILIGGEINTTAGQSYNIDVTLVAPTSFSSSGGGLDFGGGIGGAFGLTISAPGAVAFNGPIDVGSFALSAGSLPDGFPTVTTTDGGFTLALSGSGAMTLDGNYSFDNFTDDGVIILSGDSTITTVGALSLGGTVDGAFALTLDGGTVTSVTGTVGGTTALTSLTVIGANGIALGGTVTTTGAQTYENAVTLANSALLNTTGAVSFGSTLDGGFALSIDAGSVSIGTAGGTAALASLTIDAATATLGSVTTVFEQSYTGATTLGGNYAASGFSVSGPTVLAGATTVGSGTGGISFGGTVDGGQALTLDDANGTVTLAGTAGGVTPLGSLTINAGTISVGSVFTTGAMVFNGAAQFDGSYTGSSFQASGADTLMGATSVTTTAGNLGFTGTVDGGQALTLNDTGGTVTLGGTVGGTTALGSLTVTGSTISADSVTTTGGQSYTGATTLDGSFTGSSFTSTGAAMLAGTTSVTATSGNVAFGGSIDGAQSLTLAAANGSVTVAGAVGGQTALSSLTLGGGGDAVTFTGSVTTAELSDTRTSGSLTVAGGLSAATYIASASNDVLISISGGTGPLSLAGEFDFTTALDLSARTLTLTGATVLNTAANNDALTLGAVDGNFALTLDAGTAAVALKGAAGANTALASLTIHGGTISLGNVRTTGAQTYNGATTLDGTYIGSSFTVNGTDLLGGATGVTATAGNISFSSTVDGSQALSLADVGGIVTLGGAVGSTTDLGSLTITAAGIVAGNVTTAGAQNYGGALTLSSSATIQSVNGDLTFGSTINGTQSLILSAGGNIVFDGTLSSQADPTALSILTADNVTVLNNSTLWVTTFKGFATGAFTFGDHSLESDDVVTINAGSVDGRVVSSSATINVNTATGIITGNTVTVTATGAVSEQITAGAATVTDASFTGSVQATRSANIASTGDTSGTVTVSGGSAVVSGANVSGNVTASGLAQISATENVSADVVGGTVSIQAGGLVNGNVTSTGPDGVTITANTVDSAVVAENNGPITITAASSISGSATGGAVTLTAPVVDETINAQSAVINSADATITGTIGDTDATVALNGGASNITQEILGATQQVANGGDNAGNGDDEGDGSDDEKKKKKAAKDKEAVYDYANQYIDSLIGAKH